MLTDAQRGSPLVPAPHLHLLPSPQKSALEFKRQNIECATYF